ncbi:MAG: hypothetical protein ABIH46_11185 [Chloroflexota bacterium]
MDVVFTTKEAPGALRNGTIVEKVNSKPEDTHGDGARAMIVGSVGLVDDPIAKYGYFVVWDDMLGIPVLIADFRLRPVRWEN